MAQFRPERWLSLLRNGGSTPTGQAAHSEPENSIKIGTSHHHHVPMLFAKQHIGTGRTFLAVSVRMAETKRASPLFHYIKLLSLLFFYS